MPTSAAKTFTGLSLVPVYPEPPSPRQPVSLVASVTLARGTVLGELTATPGRFKAYASGNADGSEVPKCILEYDVVVDASNNISIAGSGGTGEFGETFKSVPAFFGGAFKTSELTGFDANANTKLGGHLASGTNTDGVYVF
jgi:hypothetical protein